MIQSELVKTIRYFDTGQRERFLLFLSSPYWMTHSNTVLNNCKTMCAYIFDYFDDTTGSIRIKEAFVHQHLYPKKNSKEADLSNLRSICLKAAKEFVVFDTLKQESSKAFSQMHLAHFYAQNKEADLAKRYFGKVDKWQKSTRISWSHTDFFTDINASFYRAYFLSTVNQQKKDIGLVQILKNLDIFYTHFKTHYSTILNGLNQIINVVKKKEEQALLEVDFDLPALVRYKESEIGQLKIMAYRLLHPDIKSSKEAYLDFKTALNKDGHLLYEHDFLNYWTFLKHFVTHHPDYFDDILSEVFEYQREEFSPTFVVPYKDISAAQMYSATYHATSLGELDWATDFLNRFEHNIKEKNLEKETTNYCRALLHYTKQEYRETINLLTTTAFSDNRLKLLSKILTLKAGFDAPHLDFEVIDLQNFVDSTLKWVNRDKISANSTNTKVNNFLKILRRTFQNQYGIKRSSTSRVQNDFLVINEMCERKWLAAKLEKDVQNCTE